MTIKERSILFKIHEQVKKLSLPPLTTNTALTGQVAAPVLPQPSVTPLPPLAPPEQKG